MLYVYPDYYDKFKCLAGDCKDTCCAGWQIVIDEESLKNYKDYSGDYKDKLYKKINWREGVFKQNKYRACAFLREDLLCDMFINMGEDSLCHTCAQYPRHTEEFENVREVSLSLSCPEVARILMNHPDKVTFIKREDEENEIFDDFDYFLYSILEDIRDEILATLQNQDKDIWERFERVLMIGDSAQEHYDEGQLVDWDDYGDHNKVSLENKYDIAKLQLTHLCNDLEILYPDWEGTLAESEILLFKDGCDEFGLKEKRFKAWWKNSDLMPLDTVLTQISVYFITTYLLGAVYDENIVGKVDACVANTMAIYWLLMARWIKNNEALDENDLIEVVYRYSREIEHSDENLEAVETLDWFE